MVDFVKEEIAPTSLNMSSKKELLSTAMKRTSEWIFSQEIPSDVTVQVGGVSFSLHKFPLISKSGYVRKVVSESNDADHSIIEIPNVPGGADSFELAAKFCYGINFEISTKNIAMLRCAAEYLEMTEDYAVGNLVGRTEAYLNEVALKSLAGAVSVLHMSESLLPIAEEVKLVSRCIDAIAYLACKESQFYMSSRSDSGNDSTISLTTTNSRPIVDWWAEDLAVLRIDIFQRVLIAMVARGFKQYDLGPVLMLYAQKALRGLEVFGKGRKKIEPRQEHEKRVVLETIVSLLPREKNAMSAHPTITDMERKKVCSLMDCQKLSRKACAHAAQNDRLPVQTVVQVLYHEQQRLRDVMNGSGDSPAVISSKVNLYTTDVHPVSAKTAISSPMGSITPSSDKPPLPKKSFMNSVSKKLGRLYPFVPSGAKGRTRPSKDRRHSIS
ncbi:hypothetical protein GOBAR_DD22515 [Gossypium barbadense]|nr:hypothetical protein GOBAR_DD22515 [Gossypium barbadense]